jgi:hypothetical protein
LNNLKGRRIIKMNPGYLVLLTMALLFVGVFAFGCACFSGSPRPKK